MVVEMNLAEINETFPLIFQVFFFCFGACVGSFLNVCIFRIPAGKSIVSPPSHCACGKPIAWYDNIPILAWFLLRGRARCCGSKISFRYPLVEALTAFVFLGMWCLLPIVPALVGMFFASLMVFCAFVDIDTMTLPDFATVGGTVLGFLISILLPGLHGIDVGGAPYFVSMVASAVSSVVGIAVGSGIVYWIRLLGECVFGREAMGEGDVILAGCIGAFCGWQGAVFAIFGGSVIGAVLLLPVLAIAKVFGPKKTGKKRKGVDAENEGDSMVIPFGPWLALGAVLYYVFLSDFIDAYFSNFSLAIF